MRSWSWILFTIGTFSRLFPLISGGDRLKWLLPTEDGFLMLTIARNMALGRGMSVSDGVVETNGVQPLYVSLQAALSHVVGGDRDGTLLLAMVLSAALSVASFVLARTLIERLVFPPRQRDAALFIAAAWYASPVSVQNTMNGLETVGAACANLILISVAIGLLERRGGRLSWSDVAALATSAALSFWMRIDAVLLFGAIGVGVIIHLVATGEVAHGRRWLIAALLGAVLCAPWCIDSLVRFGHPIPVSGLAQSVNPSRLLGLQEMLKKLAESMLVVVPIPGRIEALPVMTPLAAVLVAGAVIGALDVARRSPRHRLLVIVGFSYTTLIVAVYSVSSYAHHFFSRYLYPASPLVAVLVGCGVLRMLDRHRWARIPALSCVVLLVLLGNVHLHGKVEHNNYRQLVEWIEANVTPDQWVGAPQSGTIGYYHDRTINLDGKVDPRAYSAMIAGHLDRYVLEAPEHTAAIQYLVGWTDMEEWVEDLGLAGSFERMVDDPARNLLVYRRRAGATPPVSRPAPSS